MSSDDAIEFEGKVVEVLTGGTFKVKPGSLFPSLHRMDQEGWIVGSWGKSENNRRAKYYTLTARGRKQLRQDEAAWVTLSEAVGKVMGATRVVEPEAAL